MKRTLVAGLVGLALGFGVVEVTSQAYVSGSNWYCALAQDCDDTILACHDHEENASCWHCDSDDISAYCIVWTNYGGCKTLGIGSASCGYQRTGHCEGGECVDAEYVLVEGEKVDCWLEGCTSGRP